MAELLRQFDVDEGKLQVLAECMDNYGVGDPDAEWPNNILSRRAVVYRNGIIARHGEPIIFATDADELALCQRLSSEAKAIAGDMEVGMGSESGDPFHPFFITADEAIEAPTKIDEASIRRCFGGTLFPLATLSVEPLREAGTWWSEVAAYANGSQDDERDGFLGDLKPWRTLLAWFNGRAEFVDAAFVRIGDFGADAGVLLHINEEELPPGTEMTGSVLPRLVLGLTRRGSLCGLFGWSVQT